MKMGHLYFVQVDGGGPIKVGWTRGSIFNRIQQLQWASPYILHWIGAKPALRESEAAAHKHLAAYRVRGEWFHPVMPVLRFIEDQCPGFDTSEYVEEHIGPIDRFRKLTSYKGDIFDQICNEAGIGIYELAAWRERGRLLSPDKLNRLRGVISRLEHERAS